MNGISIVLQSATDFLLPVFASSNCNAFRPPMFSKFSPSTRKGTVATILSVLVPLPFWGYHGDRVSELKSTSTFWPDEEEVVAAPKERVFCAEDGFRWPPPPPPPPLLAVAS